MVDVFLNKEAGRRINKKFRSVLYIIPLIIYSTLISFGSSLNPLSTSFPHTDAQVYIYVARGILQGLTPYIDIFDHKGPLLYLLQVLGLTIGGGDTWGIWAIISVFLAVSSVICYFTIKNIVPNELVAMASTLLLLTTLGGSFAGGNTTEIMGLPFIFISFYFLSNCIFLDKKIGLIEALLIGACLGCVLTIKVSMAVLWLILPLYVLIQSYISKDYRQIYVFLRWGLVGLLLIVIPQIVYLIDIGAFGGFVNAYIKYNFDYVNKGNLSSGFYALFGYAMKGQFILANLAFVVVFVSKKISKEMKTICFVFMIYYAATLLNISFIGHQYSFYAPIILPCLCVPFAWTFNWIEHNIGMDTVTWKRMLVLLICVFIVGAGGIATTVLSVNTGSISKEDERIIELIKENTDSDDTITVLSNRNYYYLKSGRASASRYSYYIFTNRPDKEQEFLEDLNRNHPRVIIIGAHITEDKLTPDISKYLFGNYDLLESLDNYNVYIRKRSSLNSDVT